VEIRRDLPRGISSEVDLYTAPQFQTLAKSGHCALARANPVFGTDEKRIRTKNTVLDKSKNPWVCFHTRLPIAHGRLFVRAQSVIRADGTPSAQA
jgi:hypothetical protein